MLNHNNIVSKIKYASQQLLVHFKDDRNKKKEKLTQTANSQANSKHLLHHNFCLLFLFVFIVLNQTLLKTAMVCVHVSAL